MILLDTSIWIEFLKKNPQIFLIVKNLLEKQQIVGMSIIFGELLQGAKNKREIDIILKYWDNVIKSDEGNIFIEAGLYSEKNKFISKGIGLIDSAIIIFANNLNLKIWSLDKKLNEVLPKKMLYKKS